MKRRILFVLALSFLVAVISSSSHAGAIWTDGGTDHLWSNGANWDGGVAPGAGVDVEIWEETISLTKYTYGPGGGVGPTVNSTINTAKLKFRNGDIFVVQGGSLISANYIQVGYWHTDSGGVPPFIGSGRMTITGNGYVEGPYVCVANSTEGVLTMQDNATLNGGDRVEVGYNDALGHIQLDGGTITAKTLKVMAGSTIDVAGGTMIFERTYTTEEDWSLWHDRIDAYMSAAEGKLYTTLANSTVDVAYAFNDDTMVGTTTIQAIPEPATMMLLGLGGLALLRRKR